MRLSRVGLLAIAIALAGGCGSVFDLEEVADIPPCPEPVGHDEDGDGRDDGCDVCPGIADRAQVDGDGDKIGDACDPRPAATGDELVRFQAFAVATDADLWGLAPTWTVTDDAFVFVFDGTNAYIAANAAPPAFSFELQLGITLVVVDRSQYSHVSFFGNGPSTGTGCRLFHAYPSNEDVWIVDNASTRVPLPATYQNGTKLVARGLYTPTDLTCVISGTTAGGEMFAGTANGAIVQAGNISFNFTVAEARLEWFAIYKVR